MAKIPKKAVRTRRLNPSLVAEGMARRIMQRIAISGSIKLPAVPALVEEYVKICADVFAASGRAFITNEHDGARQMISDGLKEAFAISPRSKIEIAFEAAPARPLGYSVKQDVRTIADAYERWIGTSEGPLFGAHPDARVLSLATQWVDPEASPILDFGAGTGRNALALARRGHPVDAVEITPKFAEIIANAAAEERLAVRVIAEDVFRNHADLARNYRLFFASEVVPDFRSVGDLRSLFELAAEVLTEGGQLLFNVHLCAQGYTPDKAARELAQQCYSSLFTPSEVAQAAAELPFVLVANDSVYAFEKEHLPADAWPPTPWYVNWVSGLDVYEIEQENCPIELRWLVFEKLGKSGRSSCPEPNTTAPVTLSSKGGRARRFDPIALRKALARRLTRRMSASGTLILPALPGVLDTYAEMCIALFSALGRRLSVEQTHGIKNSLERMLTEAFEQSQRSNIVVTYEAPMGTELRYTVTADPVPLTEAYEEWFEALLEPMFGLHPDARLLSLIALMSDPKSCPVLDVGAGTGRNAFHLAQRGHPVDAVELTAKFAEHLAREAIRQKLPIHVIPRDILACEHELRRDYRLMLLSGTVGDFRDLAQLRRVFEIATEVLVADGLLLLSVHIAVDGYTPDAAARQWGQQCCAMFFTSSEIRQATANLPLVLQSDDSAHDYEKEHLPDDAWPPTPAFSEWALGQHMYALDREQSPIELRWLLFSKAG